MAKTSEESIERVIIKLPRSLANYFREAFPHGKRSEFVAGCIREHQHKQEIGEIEDKLRLAVKNRQ